MFTVPENRCKSQKAIQCIITQLAFAMQKWFKFKLKL